MADWLAGVSARTLLEEMPHPAASVSDAFAQWNDRRQQFLQQPEDTEYPDELLDAVRHAWVSDRRAMAVIDVVRSHDRSI